MKRTKTNNRKVIDVSRIIVNITAFIMFDAFFSLLFYVYKRENLIETGETYDYIYYGTLAAMAALLIPFFRMIMRYFINKEFEEDYEE